MGLFKFIKSAGEKLFGASEAKAAEPDALKQEAAKHGLDVGGVQVQVDGDQVKVTGTAKSTEEAEKIILAMGNTLGVDQIQSDLIVKGDTLWAIAEKSYGKGHGKDFNKIFEANRPMLTHPDKIYPGQVLRVLPLA
jgi:nucleoid-associated protein YgaU